MYKKDFVIKSPSNTFCNLH